MKLKNKLESIWRIMCASDNQNMPPQPYFDGDNENYLVDFRADRFGSPVGNYITSSVSPSGETERVVKVAVKPRDVLCELGRRPSNLSLDGLADKILMMQEKSELITQRFSKDESEGMLLCLKNRRKYDKTCKAAGGKTYREWFGQFDETDQIKIDALLKAHELVMQSADIFIPEFPSDAVKLMSAATKVTAELCGKKPRLFVISNQDQFRDALGKRDPILLVQSPFGFYYYILGAWDKEMLYLPEL